MESQPKASIVIPTCRRPEFLARCLEQLAMGKQSVPFASYEVIVVDDDPARSALGKLRSDFRWVQVAYGPLRGPAAARNTGAALARAPLIIFVDDDCVPSATLVEGYLQAAHSHLFMNGPTTCQAGCRDPFETAPINPIGEHAFSCNFACNKKFFEALRGFDEKFLFYGFEDYDFFYRARQMNVAPSFVPLAVVDHPPRPLAPVVKRVLTLENYYRYLLKHEFSPQLMTVMRSWLADWRNRLSLPVPLARRLQALGSFFAELILGTVMHDRLLNKAEESLRA